GAGAGQHTCGQIARGPRTEEAPCAEQAGVIRWVGLLEPGGRAVACHRRRWVRCLGWRASAADPVPGNPEATALDPDRGYAGARPRASRRSRRSSVAIKRNTGLRAEGIRGHRGSALLLALWGRSVRNRTRVRRQRPSPYRRPRRLHHHATARQKSLSDSGTHDQPQAPGNPLGPLAGAQVFQGTDPGNVSQPSLFRRRRLRHRTSFATLFRKIGATDYARRGGTAGWAG